jgi:hypothetical protein
MPMRALQVRDERVMKSGTLDKLRCPPHTLQGAIWADRESLPAAAKRWMMIGQTNEQRLTQRVKQAGISVQ